MGWDPPLTGDIEVDDPVDETLMEKIRASLVYLYGVTAGTTSSDVPNGDMEIDSDADGVPDLWTNDGSSAPIYGGHGSVYPGGSCELDTVAPIAGSQSIKMVHPGGAGNGGGLLESDFYPCAEGGGNFLTWMITSSAAGMNNQVLVYFYDEDKVTLGGGAGTEWIVLYQSTVNETSQTRYYARITPPANAKYLTLGLRGGYTDTDVAGSVWFDKVHFIPAVAFQRTLATGGFTEQTTSSTTYVSAGSININSRIRSTTTTVSIPVDIKSSSGSYTTSCYMVVNGVSSNVITTTSTSYAASTLSATADTTGTDQSVEFFIKTTNALGTAYAKVDALTPVLFKVV